MEIKEILNKTVDFFQKSGLNNPRLDAEVLLAEVLGKKRVELYVDFDQPLNKSEIDQYRNLVIKRKEGLPVAYLLGKQEFMSLDFEVTPDVLIPRPETEHLVEEALELIKDSFSAKKEVSIVDIGTGSGAIIISIAKMSEAKIKAIAVDISPEAVKLATKNAIRHEVKGHIEFKTGDLLEPITDKVDIVVSNPPYIAQAEMEELQPEVKSEPALALEAGSDGLKYYKQIISGAKDNLKKDGYLLFEVGDGQAIEVCQLLKKEGFKDIAITEDYAGIERIVLAQY